MDASAPGERKVSTASEQTDAFRLRGAQNGVKARILLTSGPRFS